MISTIRAGIRARGIEGCLVFLWLSRIVQWHSGCLVKRLAYLCDFGYLSVKANSQQIRSDNDCRVFLVYALGKAKGVYRYNRVYRYFFGCLALRSMFLLPVVWKTKNVRDHLGHLFGCH